MTSVFLGEEIRNGGYALLWILLLLSGMRLITASYPSRKIISFIIGVFMLVGSIINLGKNQINIEKNAINNQIRYVKELQYTDVTSSKLSGIHKLENTLLSYEFVIENDIEDGKRSKVFWLYIYEKDNTVVPTQKIKLKKLVNGQLEVLETGNNSR